MLSMMLNERWHAIIATAGTARRSTTGRSGPTVSAPISAEGGWLSADVVRDQHQSVVGAFGVVGEGGGGGGRRVAARFSGEGGVFPAGGGRPRPRGVGGALGVLGGVGGGGPLRLEPRQRV